MMNYALRTDDRGIARARWELRWRGSCYRGRWAPIGWRHVWWVPLAITVGPLVPALLALCLHLLLR